MNKPTLLILFALFTKSLIAGPSYPFPVVKGGTGAKIFTSGAILQGNGTSALSSVPGVTYGGTSGLLEFRTTTGACAGCSGDIIGQNTSSQLELVNNDGPIIFYGAATAGAGPTLLGTWNTTSFTMGYLGFNQGANTGYMDGYSNNSIAVRNNSLSNAFPLVVSAAPATNGLMIVRGGGTTGGTTTSGGEGYTSPSGSTTGTQNIAFNPSTSFQDTPMCVCSATNLSGIICSTNAATGTMSIYTVAASTSLLTNSTYQFVCIGQRLTGS